MAEKHRMIEPFVPGQVKHAHGHKLVSYATSSYGYDLPCSDEFKIFTNINSTIVVPKAFDERSFVDFKGEVIFLESAPDDVCETSYRDRGGKYQGQVGVTLPKI